MIVIAGYPFRVAGWSCRTMVRLQAAIRLRRWLSYLIDIIRELPGFFHNSVRKLNCYQIEVTKFESLFTTNCLMVTGVLQLPWIYSFYNYQLQFKLKPYGYGESFLWYKLPGAIWSSLKTSLWKDILLINSAKIQVNLLFAFWFTVSVDNIQWSWILTHYSMAFIQWLYLIRTIENILTIINIPITTIPDTTHIRIQVLYFISKMIVGGDLTSWGAPKFTWHGVFD